MDNLNRFSPMIDTITELAVKEQVDRTTRAPGIPTLSDTLADVSTYSQGTLFLGIAEDGLPVLLNLNDPIPGPILIAGDKASGKTSLLQMIARAVDLLHSATEVQYGVITQHADEWISLQSNQNNLGVYTTQDNTAQKLLQSLVTWAHNNKSERQSILVLIDDLEAMTKLDQQTEQNLRWLLLRGPSRRVWPIITINAGRAHNIEAWLGFFRTRLFGRIRELHDSNLVTSQPNKSLADLTAGSQFTLLEKNNWLNFWTPAID